MLHRSKRHRQGNELTGVQCGVTSASPVPQLDRNGPLHGRTSSSMSAVSLRNLLGFVRRLCACWVAGAIVLAFAATPAPVLVAPGIYALMVQPGEFAAANLWGILHVSYL